MMTLSSPLACFHVSNAATYAALLSAVGAVAAALEANVPGAGLLLALAALLDVFDGRFARLFTRSAERQRFGGELDSLTDAVAFGFAPVICLLALAHQATGSAPPWLWLAAFVHVACGITRLGFFNTTHETVPGFVGIPAPVAALVWSSALLAGIGPGSGAIVALALGGAMVAPIPIPRPRGAALAAFSLWPLGLIAAHAWHYAGLLVR
jgi:CDP-diacylglycerol--serine O-phosphatidyltransferase